MKFQRVSTGRSTAWFKEGEWWRKRDWGFKLKFTAQGTQSILYDNELHVLDVVQYVTHVKETIHLGLEIETPIEILFDAFKSSKPSLVESISVHVTDAGFDILASAIESDCLLKLQDLQLQNSDVGNGHDTLAKAIRWVVSGRLPSLRILFLRDIRVTFDHFEAYGIPLSSGKSPNLIWLGIKTSDKCAKSLALAIGSGDSKNSTELFLGNNRIADEGLIALADSFQVGLVRLLPSLSSLHLRYNSFTELDMLSLADALGSGKLPHLDVLDISRNGVGDKEARSLGLAIRSGKFKNVDELDLSSNYITDEGLVALTDTFQETLASRLPILRLSNNLFTEEGAGGLLSAIFANNRPIDDVEFEWDKFPKVNNRMHELIKRNSRNREILAGLVTVPKVQATFGKVYICGNPEVGKTTLRRTLQRNIWQSLQRKFWLSLSSLWETSSHVEFKRTRGIDISQLSSKGNKSDEKPVTLHVWDMAGQEEYHLVHNAFFPDLGFAEGRATTFIVVCSSKNSFGDSVEQLEYWLRYIASSCGKIIQNPRHVFVVMNNMPIPKKEEEVVMNNHGCFIARLWASFMNHLGEGENNEGENILRHAQQWKRVLENKRKRFEKYLKIQTDSDFIVDVMEFQQVQGLKSCVLELSRDLLRDQKVPDICQAIQENLTFLCLGREQFPVFHWTEFVEQVQRLQEPWPEQTIEAATRYLNEAGVIIYIHSKELRLVVVNSSWFCSEIIGKVFLPQDMASSTEYLFRTQVDRTTGSISISSFKEFFKSSKGEWSDAQADDLIEILLWLGLCYKGKDEKVFLPALIAEQGTPGDPWCLQTPLEHVRDQWVMGFSVRHQESDVALAPISLWHRFQVDLAQTLKFDSEVPDSDFVAHKYFMTFVKDYMNVLIEVDANLNKPT